MNCELDPELQEKLFDHIIGMCNMEIGRNKRTDIWKR